jgi:hypothetical protein
MRTLWTAATWTIGMSVVLMGEESHHRADTSIALACVFECGSPPRPCGNPNPGRTDRSSIAHSILCGLYYLRRRSLLTTPPWSDGHSPEGVRAAGSLPVTNALLVVSRGLVRTWSTVWSNTAFGSKRLS